MTGSSQFTPKIDIPLHPVAQARILYADTDKMGIVYHASYLRYLELARVELIRGAGLPYTVMEDAGLALPLIELGVAFRSPGLYDDRITVHVGLSRVTRVRVHFQYRVVVEPGDRPARSDGVPNERSIELLLAETRHCCMSMHRGRPARLPDAWYVQLADHVGR